VYILVVVGQKSRPPRLTVCILTSELICMIFGSLHFNVVLLWTHLSTIFEPIYNISGAT